MTTTEVEELFPTVGWLYWTPGGGSGEPTSGFAISVAWMPRSAIPQPVLTVFAVPSHRRAAIRAWVRSTAAPEAQRWIESIEKGTPVSRDMDHNRAWRWGVVDESSERIEARRAAAARLRTAHLSAVGRDELDSVERIAIEREVRGRHFS